MTFVGGASATEEGTAASPWGEARGATAGHSQFQPDTTGSSQTQPVSARHSQIRPDTARSSQTQPDPARSNHPPQGTAEPWPRAEVPRGNLGKEGQNVETVVRNVGGKTGETETKRKGRACARSSDPPAAWGEDHKDHNGADTNTAIRAEPLCWSKRVFPKETVAWGELMWEQVDPGGLQPVERREEQQSGCSGLTTQLYQAVSPITKRF